MQLTAQDLPEVPTAAPEEEEKLELPDVPTKVPVASNVAAKDFEEVSDELPEKRKGISTSQSSALFILCFPLVIGFCFPHVGPYISHRLSTLH